MSGVTDVDVTDDVVTGGVVATSGFGGGVPAVLVAVARAHAAVDEALGCETTLLSAADKGRLLVELGVLRDRVAGLTTKTLAVSAGVAEEFGARDLAGWLSLSTRRSRREARHVVGLAQRLDSYPKVAAGLQAGRLSAEHARVIVGELDKLVPVLGVDRDVVDRAEADLVERCGEFGPDQVRELARRVLDVVAPDIAETVLGTQLARQERDAMRSAFFSCTPYGPGTSLIKIVVPDVVAARLSNCVYAISSPRRHHHTTSKGTHCAGSDCAGSDCAGDGCAAAGCVECVGVGCTVVGCREGLIAARYGADTIEAAHARLVFGAQQPAGQLENRASFGHRLGQAFCQWMESLPTDLLPNQAGDPATIMITIDYEHLKTEVATGMVLDQGHPEAETGITASTVRRLACNANLIPAVLGSKSQILDLGRTTRLFSPAQRRALRAKHRFCQAEGCTIPATWCEAHHIKPWSQGGSTDLGNAVLLCSWHHHRAHDNRYETTQKTKHHNESGGHGTWRYTLRR